MAFLLDFMKSLGGEGATGKPRPVIYSFAGFTISCNQKLASISHFLEQNVCPSRARLVLRKYWE
jgi:hypothetical protein